MLEVTKDSMGNSWVRIDPATMVHNPRTRVPETFSIGRRGPQSLIHTTGLPEPCWSLVLFGDSDIVASWLKERGVL
jgi:hypothetical protein